jgi:hypothetical protein
MIFMRILPGVLKELVTHVPTVLFKVVDWGELGHEIPRLSRRVLQREGYTEMFIKQQQFLSPLAIQLTQDTIRPPSTQPEAWVAQKWLHLFFAQLFSPYGLFLDLRSHHFAVEQDELKWHPNGLWTKFRPDFQQGLLHIYDGFYLENEDLYYQGLEEIGLISPDWNSSDRDQLAQLFKNQFGSSLGDEMQFSLDSFKDSLIQISHFLLEKKVNITTDFMYLGIYLVTLYAGLEQCQHPIAVKKEYLYVRQLLQPQNQDKNS